MSMRQRQQGFVLASAIFLLVVLAALGMFMIAVSNTAQLTSAQDIQGSRAYWAAKAGVEWAAGTIDASDSARSTCHSTTIALNGFTVSVSEAGCANGEAAASYDEAGVSRHYHRVVSTASAGGAVGTLGYVERSVSATMEFCTPKATCER